MQLHVCNVYSIWYVHCVNLLTVLCSIFVRLVADPGGGGAGGGGGASVVVHNDPPKICPPGRFSLVYNVPPDILHLV